MKPRHKQSNGEKMNTYKKILLNAVKEANKKPMETLKRISKDQSLNKTEWTEKQS